MRCPNCDTEIAEAWTLIRQARRALEQCADCGKPSGENYRCAGCRLKMAKRAARRKNSVSLTENQPHQRSA